MQISNISSYLKNLAKEEQNNSKAIRKKNIIKIKPEPNTIENRKTA